MNKMKEYAAMRKAQLKEKIQELNAQNKNEIWLLIIQVGDNEASNRYVRNKMKDCEEVGIIAHHYKCPIEITTEELVDFIIKYQGQYAGVIVQQPLPAHIDQKAIDCAIRPTKDVDGFHPLTKFKPATARGIIDYLEWRNFNFEGAKVTVIGRSNIVGKPLARMLTDKDCTVTLCHSKTLWEDIWNSVNNSNLTICAVGQPGFLDCSSLSIPVIDVGINFDEEGKMCGDCFVWNGTERNVSPVPGGVGLLTRVALLENVVEAAYGN
jgi:methylenetetrahydrofolate dehydrogenase (NADP+)/methenyltetrahydrofolate cyclohydrolase